MAEQPGLLEEGSAVVANNDKPDSDVRRGHLNVSGVVCGEAERPEMDTVLEDMLHNIDIAEPLTRREGEVLRLVVSGKTNKEIARILCRTERTVERLSTTGIGLCASWMRTTRLI
jgi:hypothetical protein